MKPTYRKSWAGNLLMSDLILEPSFKVRRGYSNLKVLITCLLLVLEVCNLKPAYRKSWAGNLLMWSDLTLNPSFKVKRGQSNLKMLIARLLLILQVCNVKRTIFVGRESSEVVRFGLGPLVQGQTSNSQT